MIRVTIVRREDKVEKQFNGLDVFLNVLEGDRKVCARCKRDDVSAITRSFEVVKIVRGCVPLRIDSHFAREVQTFVRQQMGHGRCLCLDCFERLTDESIGGFAPADE